MCGSKQHFRESRHACPRLQVAPACRVDLGATTDRRKILHAGVGLLIKTRRAHQHTARVGLVEREGIWGSSLESVITLG